MGCKPCNTKWVDYYMKKGFSRYDAERMAKKLIKRVEDRQKREHREHSRMAYFFKYLRRWVFRTNWRATFLWRKWIGRGYNPDYTQACVGGDCAATQDCDHAGLGCTSSIYCDVGSCGVVGNCGCPDPLPNSSEVSGCDVACSSLGTCGYCSPLFEVCFPTCRIAFCSVGDCAYECTPPYVWNGVACALPRGIFVQIM